MASERERELSRARNKRYREKHKEAIAARQKLWSVQNKDRIISAQRKYLLKKEYNLTPEQYWELWDKQGGVCAICGSPDSDIVKGTPSHLAVDHCHETNKIRGLLCGNCNRRLKFIEDGWHMKAIEYLLEDDAIHKSQSSMIDFDGLSKEPRGFA